MKLFATRHFGGKNCNWVPKGIRQVLGEAPSMLWNVIAEMIQNVLTVDCYKLYDNTINIMVYVLYIILTS